MKITAELKAQADRYQNALALFLGRVEQDRNILAVTLLGSLHPSLIWHRHEIHLWIIERDGVSKRLKSDGNQERLFRTLVEEAINIHAEIIPRSRFKLMVEGQSRTAFACNFFESRQLVYSADQSIEKWFHQANQIATKDQDKELVAMATWLTYARRRTEDLIETRSDLPLAAQSILSCAHAMACLEIIRQGEIYEDVIIEKALRDQPELFEPVYQRIINRKPSKALLRDATNVIDHYLQQHGLQFFSPVLSYLAKTQRVTPLSEISDYFAYTQLYPWHLESACEWLSKEGHIDTHATPFHLTKRSLTEVEEPAYFLDA